MKSQALLTVWCNISGGAGGEIWHWSLSGVKGLNFCDKADMGSMLNISAAVILMVLWLGLFQCFFTANLHQHFFVLCFCCYCFSHYHPFVLCSTSYCFSLLCNVPMPFSISLCGNFNISSSICGSERTVFSVLRPRQSRLLWLKRADISAVPFSALEGITAKVCK